MKSISVIMMGAATLLLVLMTITCVSSQSVTRYRNPWVELVRQISCRSVTCNFQETCDLQVVCTPFGDCGQRATCLQVPFPRNTVCPDAFTNAGPPYTVECFDDAGCQEPMVCCHSYAKSYCHMPPFGNGNGNTSGSNRINAIMVDPTSEASLMNSGTPGNAGAATNSNNAGNPRAATEASGRGSRSVVVARSDFFDPQGFRREQRENWENALERRRRQELNALGSAVRLSTRRRDDNEIFPDETAAGTRTTINRNINGGSLTVEISGPPGGRGVVDVNGIRVGTDERQRQDDSRDRARGTQRDRAGGRNNQIEQRRPQDDILRNVGPEPRDRIDNRRTRLDPTPPPTLSTNDQRASISDRRQPARLPLNDESAAVRVNLHGVAPGGVRPFIRKTDLFRGHGFYGDNRRLLGDIQFEGIQNRFRGRDLAPLI